MVGVGKQYMAEALDRTREVAEWGGSLIVVPSEPDGKTDLAARLGIRGAAVVIADEWGEIFFAADAGAEQALPTPDEIVEWVRFISIQCPECEQPEGEWRTLE